MVLEERGLKHPVLVQQLIENKVHIGELEEYKLLVELLSPKVITLSHTVVYSRWSSYGSIPVYHGFRGSYHLHPILGVMGHAISGHGT